MAESRSSNADVSHIDPEAQIGIGNEKETNVHLNDAGAEPLEEPRSTWSKPLSFYLAFISLMVMVFLVSLDSTSLAVAIPIITAQLQGTTLEAFWASISFMLAVVITQPIYTTVSDVAGRKLPLYTGCFLFAVGSIVFAVAQSMGVVIAGRVLQGLGGGGLDVLSEVIVADLTTLKERPTWIMLLSVPMAAGSILGPIFGAVFSEFVDWRWIGWINLPLIALATILAVFFLRLRPIELSFRARLARLDWVGMALFAVGSTAVSLPLSWAGEMFPWSSWRTILPLAIGAVVLLAFGLYERWPVEPVFPYRIFRSRTAKVSVFGGFIHGMVLYVGTIYLPLFFQAVSLETPLRSAISVLPVCVMVVFFSGAAAGTVDCLKRYRPQIWFGWITLAVGVGLMTLLDRTSPRSMSASFQVIAGIGLGSLFTLPSIPLQASVPKVDDQGLAVGILVCFRLFGALIGLAVGATTFSNVFGREIALAGKLPDAVAILQDASEAIGFIPQLRGLEIPHDVMVTVQEAYRTAIQTIWYVMAALGSVGFLTSLAMEELTLDTEEVGRQHFQHEKR